MNELRKDYILNRWVVIATERKRRPSDFIQKSEEGIGAEACPFCPENEHMTPPATLVYILEDGKLKKVKEKGDFRYKNWIVRCVPNLYPAFTPPIGKIKRLHKTKAFGHHEVVIESPSHDEHPGQARLSQLIHAINACLDRLSTLAEKSYVKYVSIFRNHKREAGASLSHTHTQIIATPMMPRLVVEEIKASKRYWRKNGLCIFCEILKREKKTARFIWENSEFTAFAPWASINPFEFWIFPKKHQSSPLEMEDNSLKALAEILRVCLGGLRNLLNDPPYNFGFHIAPNDVNYNFYHWHLEVYPKLSIWAGFEKSTGVYINVIPPEDAAKSLREAVENERENLNI